MKQSLKTLLIVIFLFASTKVIAQNKNVRGLRYTGYEYVMNEDTFVPFKYTRSYTTDGVNFFTIYKIYNPNNGRLSEIITATHFVAEKKIVVDIENADGGLGSHINTEQTTYEIPSLKAFGFRGSVGALGGSRVPNQLMVKFLNNNFQYIKVVNINVTPAEKDDYFNFILDEKN